MDRWKPKHGLNEAVLKELNILIKAKVPELPQRAHITDDAVYSVTTTDGKGTASYCRHCGRFTKGATAHTTEEHKGTIHRFPHDPNAPPETEKKNDAAPAAGASAQLALVPENQPLDLSHVPQVSTQDFLNRQVDYDFGNMASVSSLQA